MNKKRVEKEIRKTLLELGVPDHLTGHEYIVVAISLSVENGLYTRALTKALYPDVAKICNSTATRVERGIRRTVGATFDRSDVEVLNRFFGNTISIHSGKPTSGEFISRMTNEIRMRLEEDNA